MLLHDLTTKRALALLLLTSAVYSSCLAFADTWDQSNISKSPPRRSEIPTAVWEPIFFESINKVSDHLELYRLRNVTIAPGDIEVRLWVVFGLGPLQTIILRRVAGKWSGWSGPSTNSAQELEPLHPRSNWETVWSKLSELGIMELPDASSLPDEVGVFDGISYVVEINADGKYRTYEYGNPAEQPWPEAKKMVRIARVLDREFGLGISDLDSKVFHPEIEHGQVVLVKKGKHVGAFIVDHAIRFSWIYRTDGRSDLTAPGFSKGGPTPMEKDGASDHIQFGPFKLATSRSSSAESYLYFPVAQTPAGEEPLAIAVTNRTEFQGINADDPKWKFQTAPGDEPL